MGLDDCTADSAGSYVDLAVRLAADQAYRESVHRKIRSSSAVLFEDLEEVRALERFFQKAVAGV